MAFPPFEWTWMVFLSGIPILACFLLPPQLKNRRLLTFPFSEQGTLKSWGLGFFLWGLFFQLGFNAWLLELAPWASFMGALCLWVSLSIYSGLFYGLFGLSIYYVRHSPIFWLYLPFFWIFCELLRSLGPFGNPGGVLGYTFASQSVILQLASIIGVYGLSFVVMIGIVLITRIVQLRFVGHHGLRSSSVRLVGLSAIAIVLIASLMGYVLKISFQKHIDYGDTVKEISVAILQGNHDQHTKLASRNWIGIQKEYIQLLQNSDANLTVLPETVVPSAFSKSQLLSTYLLQEAARKNQYFLVGYPVRDRTQNAVYNAMVLYEPLSDFDRPLRRYDKQLLMPFGEYIPFRSFLTQIPGVESLLRFGEFSFGEETANLLAFEGVQLGSSICLESVYTTPLLNQVRRGADVLVVAANNAWFGESSASMKHLQFSVLRAVENRRYLLHASNTGPSAIISPTGAFVARSSFLTRDRLQGRIYHGYSDSFYTKWRVVLMCVWAGLFLGLLFVGFKKRSFFFRKRRLTTEGRTVF